MKDKIKKLHALARVISQEIGIHVCSTPVSRSVGVLTISSSKGNNNSIGIEGNYNNEITVHFCRSVKISSSEITMPINTSSSFLDMMLKAANEIMEEESYIKLKAATLKTK